MVQFIREQARQYAADQSGAIAQQQKARNISEINSVIQGAGSIYSGIQKGRERADEDMINTQINDALTTDAMEWNYEQIATLGRDPSSEEYKKALYDKINELYKPYADKMQTDKGRQLLEASASKTAEKIRQSNIGKIAQNRKKAQAQAAFKDVRKNMAKEAQEFGKLGDWEGFKEGTKENKEALMKYGKANNIPGTSEYDIDYENFKNYLVGVAQTDPEAIAVYFDDKDLMKHIIYKKAPWGEESDDFIQKTLQRKYENFEKDYEKTGQHELSKEEFLKIVPESLLNQTSEKVKKESREQMIALQEEMKKVPDKSMKHTMLQGKYILAKENLENPENKSIEAIREVLKKEIVPIAEQTAINDIQQQDKIRREQTIQKYTLPLSPNRDESIQGQLNISSGRTQAILQSETGYDYGLNHHYNEWAKAKTTPLTQKEVTFEGTKAISEKMQKFLSTPEGDTIKLLSNAYDLLVEMHQSNITQDQWEDLNNIMYGVIKDKGFADLASSVLENNNRYFPEIPWVQTGNATFFEKPELWRIAGLPSGDTTMIDPAAVTEYLDAESVNIGKEAMARLALAAQLPTPEEREAAVNEINNYVSSEKSRVFNKAMKTYGIDLLALEETKQKYGYAYTTLGSGNMVEYLGKDPSTGSPMFKELDIYGQAQDARKRIMAAVESIKKEE